MPIVGGACLRLLISIMSFQFRTTALPLLLRQTRRGPTRPGLGFRSHHKPLVQVRVGIRCSYSQLGSDLATYSGSESGFGPEISEFFLLLGAQNVNSRVPSIQEEPRLANRAVNQLGPSSGFGEEKKHCSRHHNGASKKEPDGAN